MWSLSGRQAGWENNGMTCSLTTASTLPPGAKPVATKVPNSQALGFAQTWLTCPAFAVWRSEQPKSAPQNRPWPCCKRPQTTSLPPIAPWCRPSKQAQADVTTWHRVAQVALVNHREDLARAALHRKVTAQKRANDLSANLAHLIEMQLSLEQNRSISEGRYLFP